MDGLVKRLNDYHTKLHWEGKPTFFTPSLCLGLAEDQIVVVKSEETIPTQPGDIVLKVGDENAKSRFDKEMRKAFGATRYAKIRNACQKMIEGAKGSKVKLRLFNPSKGEFELLLERKEWSKEEPPISSRSQDDVGYIRISRWGNFDVEEFDTVLASLPFAVRLT